MKNSKRSYINKILAVLWLFGFFAITVLKAIRIIDCPWVWVLSIAWMPAAVNLVICIVCLIMIACDKSKMRTWGGKGDKNGKPD
jgi:hypothetical protein